MVMHSCHDVFELCFNFYNLYNGLDFILSAVHFQSLPHLSHHTFRALFPSPAEMGYPESFEGFMIEDQKKWTEFKKQEVFWSP